MQPIENEICQIAEVVWDSILNLPIQRCIPSAAAFPPHMLTGQVQIKGAWNGAVKLSCPVGLVQQFTTIITGESAVTTEQSQDVLGELSNMIGGNIKALLPEPCSLSVPSVSAAAEANAVASEDRLVAEVAFECLGESVTIRLLEYAGQPV